MGSREILHDRVLGGLVGVHCGDSLGATHEFRSWIEITEGRPAGWRLREIEGGGAFDWRPGDATDDTDLTICVLDAYLADGGFRLEQAADNMLAWLRHDPRDVGGATRKGLRAYERTGDPRRAGAGPGSAGNGSLMRCLPTALARADADLRMAESAAISGITHDDSECVVACVAYNEIAAGLLAGLGPEGAIDVGIQAAIAFGAAGASGEVVAAIEEGTGLRLADLAEQGGNPYGGSGYVLHSLSLAVAAILDGRGMEVVLADVVHLGGDTDTNGAIAGGLLGVRDGAGSIPTQWTDVIRYRQHLIDAAAQLVHQRLADTS